MAYLKNVQYDKNGNLSYRCLVFSYKKQRWSAVARATRGKNDVINSRGSYQIVDVDDVIIYTDESNTVYIGTVTHIHDSEVGSTLDNLVIELNDLYCTTIYNLMRAFTNDIDLWLRKPPELRKPEYDDFVPAGVGWDGKNTLYDIRKRDRIRTLLWNLPDDMLLISLLDCAQISPYSEIPTLWDDAIILPNNQQLVYGGNIKPNTVLVFCIQWDKDYKVSVEQHNAKELLDNKYAFKINGSSYRAMIGYINETESGNCAGWTLYRR